MKWLLNINKVRSEVETQPSERKDSMKRFLSFVWDHSVSFLVVKSIPFDSFDSFLAGIFSRIFQS